MGEADDVELEVVVAHPRRRARAALTVAALVVVTALVGSQLTGDDESSQVAVGSRGLEVPDDGVVPNRSDGASTSTIETSTSEAVTTTAAGSSPAPPADGSPADPPTTPESTTTTTVCSSSFDPECGRFRWTTAVGANQPMVATIEVLTQHPVAGERVYLRLRATDPDATPFWPSAWLGVPSDQDSMMPFNCWGNGTFEGFGPWVPPAPRGGSVELTQDVLPHEPGTYRVYGCFNSMSWVRPPHGDGELAVQHFCPGDGRTLAFEGWVCRDPYRDFASPYVDIVVAPEP